MFSRHQTAIRGDLFVAALDAHCRRRAAYNRGLKRSSP
jgi:hypothetical protein